jgi:hypothetical protein
MANQPALGPTWCFTASSSVAAVTPQANGLMELMLDPAGPATDQVASLDSVSLLRDPFPIVNFGDVLTLGRDRNTRVILFVKNLPLVAGESASAVMIDLLDSNGQVFNVPAETVRPVSNTDFMQVTFRLPTDLASGKCMIMIEAHGQLSNRGSIRIGG